MPYTQSTPEISGARTPEQAPNRTGLPDGLKAKMEGAFGTRLDHIRVNKNSGFPAKVGAIATTQGHRIDFAPGQYNPHSAQGQKLIGHEAWHTVQQAQGRVKPTLQMKTGHLVNDSEALEAEADRMGERVATNAQSLASIEHKGSSQNNGPIQRVVENDIDALQGLLNILSRAEREHVQADKALMFDLIAWLEEEQNHSLEDVKEFIAFTMGNAHVEAMEAMIGKGYSWTVASHPNKPTSFQKNNTFLPWLLGEEKAAEPTNMNCWESVLYAAHKTGFRSKTWIKYQIKVKGQSRNNLVDRVIVNGTSITREMDGATGKAVVPIPENVIPKGFVVAFGEMGQHVALSTGRLVETPHGLEHEILELDNDDLGVKATTIEAAIRRNFAYGEMVSWGPLP